MMKFASTEITGTTSEKPLPGVALLQTIQRYNLVVAILVVGASAFFRSTAVTFGTALGASVTAANLYLLSLLLRRFAQGVSGRAIAWYLLKFLALLLVVGLIVNFLPISAYAFLAGFSTFVVVIVLVPLISARQKE